MYNKNIYCFWVAPLKQKLEKVLSREEIERVLISIYYTKDRGEVAKMFMDAFQVYILPVEQPNKNKGFLVLVDTEHSEQIDQQIKHRLNKNLFFYFINTYFPSVGDSRRKDLVVGYKKFNYLTAGFKELLAKIIGGLGEKTLQLSITDVETEFTIFESKTLFLR